MSFSQPLTLFDPEVAAAVDAELEREHSTGLSAERAGALRGRVARLAAAFPLHPELNGAAA
ncbi:hypothetical protein [Streptomyces sp. DSM 15324]|uniref:hypothetical protein n=1 Tax=Streptomyces sp. DSM 15324 TaxID=1739111 RepID=UPI000749DD7C|nr:hypothetical protein [Streptomyces sp. DSM 15324]KUO08319.1 hypothetical protein AQJ58_30420 [Streptomyces sp. DSM 15324]